MPRARALVIYANAFVVGAALMGFEMLGSRYLFPYFGGGIGTWAALISTVLVALTVGYLVGGAIVDRYPSSIVIAIACALAAVYLAVIPPAADPVMSAILESMGDGPVAILLASAVLCLVPLTFLGTFSPVAVRLLVRSTDEVGRVAGLVYGISTFGNVFGVLFTTFTLIPAMGSRAITYLFAAVLGACAVSLFFVRKAEH
ncbi:MAG: fused MFS/spermidine synthase [Alphaproteobacteria bacterium]|nr:fused MFS/spermidine synthase [Alphaproteobacteria bacterium]